MQRAEGAGAPRGRRRVAIWSGLLLLAIYLLTTGGQTFISDGEVLLITTVRIVDAHTLTLPDYTDVFPQSVVGQGGFHFSRYGAGQPAAAAPLYWLGRAVLGKLPGAIDVNVGRFLALLLPALATALTGGLLCAWGARLYGSLRMGAGLALLYGVGTLAWPYSRFFFSEPLFTACIVLGAFALYEDRPLIAGLGLGYAIATRVGGAMLLPAFLVYAVWRSQIPRPAAEVYERQQGSPLTRKKVFAMLRGRGFWTLFWLGLGMVPGALLVLANNWIRFRTLGERGYEGQGFTGEPLEGLLGLLFSPGKSVFLYVPLLLALPFALRPFARRFRPEAALIGLLSVITLLQSSYWWIWWGGWGWGPRFLVPLMPLLILPLGVLLERRAWRRVIVLALLPLSLAVNLLGILVDFNAYLAEIAGSDMAREQIYLHQPAYSPILQHLWRLDLRHVPIVSFDLARPLIGLPPAAALLASVGFVLLLLGSTVALTRSIQLIEPWYNGFVASKLQRETALSTAAESQHQEAERGLEEHTTSL
jgi:hypothetical protein